MNYQVPGLFCFRMRRPASHQDVGQQRQPVVSPLVLLPLQDDVMLDQGRLALAHPTNLRVRHNSTCGVKILVQAFDFKKPKQSKNISDLCST